MSAEAEIGMGDVRGRRNEAPRVKPGKIMPAVIRVGAEAGEVRGESAETAGAGAGDPEATPTVDCTC